MKCRNTRSSILLTSPRRHGSIYRFMFEKQRYAAWIGIALLYLVQTIACGRTLLPWSDEAWFASPALNLITKGNFGTSVLDTTAVWRTNNLTRIDQHTYWITPLY